MMTVGFAKTLFVSIDDYWYKPTPTNPKLIIAGE